MDVILSKETQIFNCKYINDPVYGGIGISSLELQLISTPIFQRLRGLRQLAHVNYVFPGAEHSRFSHSLGVLYIMSLMTDHLLRKGDILMPDVIKMRVAALLHDIGHYPLSHLGESAYSFCKDNISASALITEGIDMKTDFPLYELSSYHGKSAHHEQLGKYIIEKNQSIGDILRKYNIDPQEIGSIITGEIGSKNMVYSQLLHSSLDADRLDYLLRDSYQTGVKYGLVDFEYLIRLLEVVDKKLVCNKKGQHVVEHFLMCRYFHYSQVIGHKTSLAFEGIIKSMYIKMIMNRKLLYNSLDDIKANINSNDFLQFNDSMLYHAFYEYYKEDKDADFNKLYECFIERKRPKVIYEISELHDGKMGASFHTLIHALRKSPEKISEILNINNNEWGYQVFPVKIEQIPASCKFSELTEDHEEELREAIKVADSNGMISYLAEDKLSIINKLADFKNETIRVFVLDGKTDQEYKDMSNRLNTYIN